MGGDNNFFTALKKEIEKQLQYNQGELFDEDGIEEKDLFGSNDEYDEAQEVISRSRKENQGLKEANQKLQQAADEHSLRIRTFNKLFILMVFWLIITIVTLVLSGGLDSFNLSDAVLITLLSTTTLNVLGIFAIAAKWLFPKK